MNLAIFLSVFIALPLVGHPKSDHAHDWDYPNESSLLSVIDTNPPMVCHKVTLKCLSCGADSSYHWDEPMILLSYPVAPAPKAVTHCPPHDWCWGDTARVDSFNPASKWPTKKFPWHYELHAICRACLAETTVTWRIPPETEYEKLKAKKDGK